MAILINSKMDKKYLPKSGVSPDLEH